MKRLATLVAAITCVLAAAASATAAPDNKNSQTVTCGSLTLTSILQNNSFSLHVVGGNSVFVQKSVILDGTQLVRDVSGNFEGKDLITCSGSFVDQSGTGHTFTATGFLT